VPDTPTVKYAIARPADTDFVTTWPATMRAALDWLDANIATAITTTPRPAAGKFGRLHRAADGTLTFDTGAAWVEIPTGSVAARLQSGGVDPLTVTYSMLDADVPLLNIGDQVATARQTLPANGKWAWCDGSLIRGDLYPAFAATVGDFYNGGAPVGNDVDGHPLVKLPDKRGRASIGAGAGAGLSNRVRGARFGAEAVALAITNLPQHHHLLATQTGATAFVAYAGGGNAGATGNAPPSGYNNGFLRAGVVADTAGNAAGVGGAHDNMSPVEVDNWMVRIA
jgi:microcystin-dependent protein